MREQVWSPTTRCFHHLHSTFLLKTTCFLLRTQSAAFCPSTFYIWLITIFLIRKQKPRRLQQNVQVSTALAVSKSTFLLVIMLMKWLIKFLLVNQNNDINLRYRWVLHLLGLDPDKIVLPTSLEDVGWEIKNEIQIKQKYNPPLILIWEFPLPRSRYCCPLHITWFLIDPFACCSIIVLCVHCYVLQNFF